MLGRGGGGSHGQRNHRGKRDKSIRQAARERGVNRGVVRLSKKAREGKKRAEGNREATQSVITGVLREANESDESSKMRANLGGKKGQTDSTPRETPEPVDSARMQLGGARGRTVLPLQPLTSDPLSAPSCLGHPGCPSIIHSVSAESCPGEVFLPDDQHPKPEFRRRSWSSETRGQLPFDAAGGCYRVPSAGREDPVLLMDAQNASDVRILSTSRACPAQSPAQEEAGSQSA